MNLPLRRRWLASCAGWLAAAAAWPGRAAGPLVQAVSVIETPAPLARVHVDGQGDLLGVTAGGAVWQHRGGRWRPLCEGLDPATPLASGQGRSAGRSLDGGLWLLEPDGGISIGQTPRLAAHAGLLIQRTGVVALVQGRDGRDGHDGDKPVQAVRLAPDGAARWHEAARSRDSLLPDATPVAFDPTGRAAEGSGAGVGVGTIAVFAGPDGQRYRHGALGDEIEATRLLLLDPLNLKPLAELTLLEPNVFEDLAPRPITWRGGQALLTMRAGPQGGQLAIITSDGSAKLTLAALGPPIGSRYRWLAPSTDGTNLFAVHTPHIGGVLHRYRAEGDQLLSEQLASGLSNHQNGQRELGLSLWFGAGLLLPSQDRRQLQLFDSRSRGSGSGSISTSTRWDLPAPVVALRHWVRAGQPGALALLADGRLSWLAAPMLPS